MSSSSDYKVILASDAHLLREALRVRMEVFHQEQGFPSDTEIDSYDPLSAHFVLVPSSYTPPTASSDSSSSSPSDDVKVLGTLRWVPYPPPQPASPSSTTSSSKLPLGRPPTSEAAIAATFASDKGAGAKLGRLALDKSLRGKGLGAFLVRESEKWVVQAIEERLRKGRDGVRSAVAEDGVGIGQEEKEKQAVPKRLEVQFRLHSQMQVVEFYKNLGYQTQGDEFDEDGAPHLLCVKTVVVEA